MTKKRFDPGEYHRRDDYGFIEFNIKIIEFSSVFKKKQCYFPERVSNFLYQLQEGDTVTICYPIYPFMSSNIEISSKKFPGKKLTLKFRNIDYFWDSINSFELI